MTPQEEKRIREWNDEISRDIQISLLLTEDRRNKEFREFSESLERLASRLRIIKEKGQPEGPPAIQIGSTLRYHAIPLGAELEPFLQTLSLSPNKLPAVPMPLQKRLQQLKLPTTLKLFIAQRCPVCPTVVPQITGLAKANELAKYYDIDVKKCNFVSNVKDVGTDGVDIVVSHDSFEHFSQPAAVLGVMERMIGDVGKIIITFGPPWFAPYGSHMHFFCNIPWANILFSEKTIMKVRSRYVNDGATRFEEVESGLNKMTLKKFEKIIAESSLSVEYKKYTSVRGINFFSEIPLIRELLVNHVTVVLSKHEDSRVSS